MGALTLVFLLLGIGGGGRLPDILNGAATDTVIAAGHHIVSAAEFRTIFEQQKQKLEQQSGQTYTNDFLVQNGFDQELVNAMALDQSEAELLRRSGIVPANSLVDAQIKKIPFAFDKVTGKFSQQQFVQFLAAQGLTVRQVESDLGDELAQKHFSMALAGGFQMPRAYAAINAIGALQERDVSYFLLDPHVIPPPKLPTDADLTQFIKDHASQLMRPELRTISLVQFDAASLNAGVQITDAQIQKEFDAEKATLSTPETRSIVQIPVKSAAQAAAAVTQLSRGVDPATVAKSLGVDPVIYTDKAQADVADKALAAAAFKLPLNTPKGPVSGDLGQAVLEVTKITPAKTPALADERSKIEAQLRQKAAADKAYAMSEAFDTARQGGANLAAAAQKAGGTVVTLGPLTAQGTDPDGHPLTGLNDKIVKAAFAAVAGETTDITDAGPGAYFALHVDKVTPPSLPTVADDRANLTRLYMTTKMRDAFRQKAESLEAEIRSGKSVDAVAASVGAHAQHLTHMQLLKASAYQAQGRDFVGAAFAAKAGETFASNAPGGAFVGKVEATRPGDLTQTAAVTNLVRGRIGQDYITEVVDALRQAAEREVAVRTNIKVARQALGVDPNLGAPGTVATGKGAAAKPGGAAKSGAAP